METKVDSSLSTNTATVDTENVVFDPIEMPACLLILFAEYLGYETPLIEWCEEWCTKDDFPEFKKQILFVDAKSMLTAMKKDYSMEKLHEYYNRFYDVAIKSWATKLKQHDLTIDMLTIDMYD